MMHSAFSFHQIEGSPSPLFAQIACKCKKASRRYFLPLIFYFILYIFLIFPSLGICGHISLCKRQRKGFAISTEKCLAGCCEATKNGN